ncbi:MAG: hypothetical protein GY759_01025 [Chloroflexi bacterium]|nr:hypothetical protein [Chloroflexota bacterium]
MATTIVLDPDRLAGYRQDTFCLAPELSVKTPADAVDFVNTRGYIHFWPISGVTLPNLWAAVAGARSVANDHDDPGHITWGWKDQALDQRWWYYAKVVRGKATMISLDTAPYFYALSENYGDPEEDYLDQYLDGKLSHEAKIIYDALLEGPLDTVTLRRKIRMTGKASNSPFERALTYLQRDFKILPVGVARTGAWRYSFKYECVHRWYPQLPAKARSISRNEARIHLASLFFRSVGAATSADAGKILQWPRNDMSSVLQTLVERKMLVDDVTVADAKGVWLVLPELVA